MTDGEARPLYQPPDFRREIPPGDDRERLVCRTCGFIDYVNPRMVVGSVVTWENRILLCRRAIEPRRNYWTLPAGFLEEHETTEAGAKREAREEACADIRIEALLAIYNIPRISQVQLIYKAALVTPDISPGPESQEVILLEWEEIPWEELAFPSVHWALHHYRAVQGQQIFAPFSNPPGESGNLLPGTRPQTAL